MSAKLQFFMEVVSELDYLVATFINEHAADDYVLTKSLRKGKRLQCQAS